MLAKVEDKIIASYLELVTKLNETVFQPLFRRSVDWAFGENSCTPIPFLFIQSNY